MNYTVFAMIIAVERYPDEAKSTNFVEATGEETEPACCERRCSDVVAK